MSDSGEQPQQPEQRDPWAPPQRQVPLSKSPVPGPAAGTAPPPLGPQPPPASGDPGAVPPPPIAPTGPGAPMGGPAGGPTGGPGYVPYGGPPYDTGPYAAMDYGAAPYGGPPAGGGYYGYPGAQGMGYGPGWGSFQSRPNNGLGTAAMVLGIISVVLFFTTFLAIILGILAVIFGVVGRARASRREATNGGSALAGLILGVVGILAGAALLILAIVVAQDEDRNNTDIHSLRSRPVPAAESFRQQPASTEGSQRSAGAT